MLNLTGKLKNYLSVKKLYDIINQKCPYFNICGKTNARVFIVWAYGTVCQIN